MRESYETQNYIFETLVPDIEIPGGRRNAFYSAIRSLQWIYPRKDEICKLIASDLCRGKSSKKGAKGLSGWQVLVFGALRMIKGKTFEELEVYANEMPLIRQLLEVPSFDKKRFNSKTLQENLGRVSPESLDAINKIFQDMIVEGGYENGKNVRADSFACKRPIHYPTDQSIMWDASRVLITLCSKTFGDEYGWRQSDHLKKKSKRLCRNVSKSKRGGGKGKAFRVKSAYRKQIKEAKKILRKTFLSLSLYKDQGLCLNENRMNNMNLALLNLGECIEQTERRAIRGEKIESKEKILSVFEKETEWINRGKFPMPYEFGHRVFLAEGKSGIILDYSTGLRKSDLAELTPMLDRLKKKYGHLEMISLDKGFWRKGVREELVKYVNRPVIAAKGKMSEKEKEIQKDPSFKRDRQWRSGVESLISSCVRGNGMGRCRDKGLNGYRRWVGLGVFSRNLITFGRILEEEERKKEAA